MLWARVQVGGRELCVANLHASAGLPAAAAPSCGSRPSGRSSGRASCRSSSVATSTCARPAIPRPFAELDERFGLREPTEPNAIDHLLARGLELVESPRRLAPETRELPGPDGLRIRLSDHAVVTATFGLA